MGSSIQQLTISFCVESRLWRLKCTYPGVLGRCTILKISTEEGVRCFTLRIEGKVVGDWVLELQRIWVSVAPLLGAKKLQIDICELLYLDDRGRRILREIVKNTDAEILADSPLTKQFANELRQNLQTRAGEEREHAEDKLHDVEH